MGIEVQTQSKPEAHAAQDASAVPRQKQEAPTAAEVAAQRQKNEAARRLLQEWLADDSGYDEEGVCPTFYTRRFSRGCAAHDASRDPCPPHDV